MSLAFRRPRLPRLRTLTRAIAPGATIIDDTPRAPMVYVGLATRAIAFALDVALIDIVAFLTAVVTGLALSVLNIPSDLETAAITIGAAIYMLWVVGYFVFFWSTTGQTPGSRVMRIRVCDVSGSDVPLLPRRALVRFAGLTLAALPMFAGLLVILVSDRRRGLQDWLARTVVVEHDDAASLRRRNR